VPILSFVTPPKYTEADVWRVFLDETGPATVAEGLALFDTVKDEPLSLVYQGSFDAVTDVPVALLLTRDVSASDYFPNAFKGSPRARIFGPHPTNGAFSTFLGFSYWLALSFQLASQDTLNHDGTRLCARGVVPDEIVEPRQSDLVQGIDTVYEAALTWVRANLKPQENP
jgi:C-terminal processing protease CtpA/Prc